MHMIRRALRGKAQIVMGKNTLIRFIVDDHAKITGNQKLLGLSALCRLNVGLVFTNDDLKEVRDILEENRVDAPARVGAVAPKTVYVPAGITGLEPTRTSFFAALSVPTKITKGSIEILSQVTLINEGEKCGASQVALLNKLNIRPFTYGLSVCKIWDNGSVYPPAVLDITDEDITSAIQSGITAVASISLATGFPTAAAVPHLLVQGMNNVFAISLATEYSFPEADELKQMLANPGAFSTTAPKIKITVQQPDSSSEDDDDYPAFGLF